ncbi:MAG: DUF5679 domain-containing protein [Dehalococcoidales bacterium]|nr:DUF5679 domain-containing protein [Dehalococcoidales bacterium]
MKAYCFKCREKVNIKSPEEVTLKNDKKATSGVCPTCNAKIYTFGKSQKPPTETMHHRF